MISRTVLLLGLTVALGACAKSSTTTDGMAPPTKRDTVSTAQKADTMRMTGDSVRRDTTGMTPKSQ